MAGGFLAAFSPLLDLFYPPGCAGCGRKLESAGIVLCERCLAGIVKFPAQGCPRCGSSVEEDGLVCRLCGGLAGELDKLRSAAWFLGPVPTLIHRFKYQGLHSLAQFFAELTYGLEPCRELIEEAEVVVPVPLHPWRKFRRGYNQSEILGRALVALTGKEIDPAALVRARATKSQTRLTPEQRRMNVAGAFRSGKAGSTEGRTVLLVDDVMTTGATLGACAHALKQAGAKRVLGLTFARA
ncbi:MAG: hypothetical protein A3F83_09820 [Candidatus Glassbacteria bacterium RIFCSPLOWO2_12_FULL_58_11]|uniref:Phosphoribosyltransferase domain-containing protein n=2 Tax=Candidatus Glassiibacteriota TaxID=1817805 RepID=A0A1F5YZ61_9BACT|nr:MAG: hypothetical protein A2Z86_04645 [Candidatus Glassbacteria bacterium GWA2_58_10]OGG05479.1 MAG: hypothetical protein A3F83_09820 [Candidatus Glassbacteria bacterium RIFCSPLOWO2_12_FULL_58_11]